MNSNAMAAAGRRRSSGGSCMTASGASSTTSTAPQDACGSTSEGMLSDRMGHRGAVEAASGVEGLGAGDKAENAFTPSGGHESAPGPMSQEGHVASVNCWCRPVRDEEEPTVWLHSDQ